MNPVYTGKDVSYIDTKQAQRAAETAATDAEKLATFAVLLGEGRYPEAVARQGLAAARLRRAPRRDHRLRGRPGLHRPAHRLARGLRPGRGRPRRRARRRSCAASTRPATGRRWSSSTRRVRPHRPGASRRSRRPAASASSTTPAPRCPSSSRRQASCASWLVTSRRWAGGPTASWMVARRWLDRRRDRRRAGDCRERRLSGHRRPRPRRHADLGPRTGDGGRELLTGPGNELRVYEEYAAHPRFSEGPWHLLPNGRSVRVGGRRGASPVAGERDRSPTGQHAAWSTGSSTSRSHPR